jgi:flagellar motility protein MotE (MotC chaperone)
VDPLEKSRDAAMADLEQKKKELAVVKEKVRALNEKVNKLKKDLEEAERVK